MPSFSPLRFRQYATDLSLAVYGLSMGISSLKQQLAHVPGIQGLTMQHGNGGATEIYRIGETSIELPAGTSTGQIAQALANPFQFPKKKVKLS